MLEPKDWSKGKEGNAKRRRACELNAKRKWKNSKEGFGSRFGWAFVANPILTGLTQADREAEEKRRLEAALAAEGERLRKEKEEMEVGDPM